jgi:hypothetical protein
MQGVDHLETIPKTCASAERIQRPDGSSGVSVRPLFIFEERALLTPSMVNILRPQNGQNLVDCLCFAVQWPVIRQQPCVQSSSSGPADHSAHNMFLFIVFTLLTTRWIRAEGTEFYQI